MRIEWSASTIRLAAGSDPAVGGARSTARAREVLLAQILDAAPWLDLQGFADLMVRPA
ncbi:hypothetical protein SAMN06295879_2315 [Agreia bicolorata]|uniref:Uncharacterized protein n=1 Tax=Agreia bicolorata TaxID=110935 RepID=A0A1T4Y6G3_9MICO|nr:hypothetical protein [Agreia bicolorata]SKA97326.1 hypothetical protein SAMN06295879_2315 [Agreia bicolorata]